MTVLIETWLLHFHTSSLLIHLGKQQKMTQVARTLPLICQIQIQIEFLSLDSGLAIAVIYGVNQPMENLFSPALPFK